MGMLLDMPSNGEARALHHALSSSSGFVCFLGSFATEAQRAALQLWQFGLKMT